MKHKSTRTWAFVVSLSIVAATTVMVQQPAELPEQAAAVALETTLSMAAASATGR